MTRTDSTMTSTTNAPTTESSKPNTFSVAIVGGGIGGLALALGLLKYDHIDVQIYEAAHSFGEIGAGVAFGVNTQCALKLIGPHAWGAFEKHATPNKWESHADVFADHIVGQGEHEGELICSQKTKGGMRSVHRAHFLDELVRGVPTERAHFNKRVQSIEEKQGSPVVLHFKDGMTATADAVVGADGIHSSTREFILGERDMSVHSVFAGSVAYRGLIPMDKAVEKLGAEYAQNSMFLCGPGKAILSYPIDLGKILNIVVMDFERPSWESEKWIMPATYAQLDALFTGWGEKARSLIALLDSPSLTVWAMRDDLPAPTYTVGHVAMMGDAAHATTPFQGQGAGQAIEDALVLETVLGRVGDAKSIANAFAAYDQVRRPRSQRVVKTSREAGRLVGMLTEGVGSDLVKIRQRLETRMHWIWNRDLEKQNAEAVALFEESL
ncbi:MAG: hypothetical protein ALECFALPRED_001302 [Alectoria fallacina]|uniref:FAD-binding domain-containing protein n=1 Tax=Alectoria fallacina TaxID=1903189 RepID=A0A8H3FD22_9LECA|nr:MAG: hypothetical protein ALECFALPRED_001302 [Alectoria fallacina]